MRAVEQLTLRQSGMVFLLGVTLLASCADKVTPRGPADTTGRTGLGSRNREAVRAEIPRPPTTHPAEIARDEEPRRIEPPIVKPATPTGVDAGKAAFLPGGPASVLKDMYEIAKANDGRSIKRFFSKSSATLIEDLAKRLGGSEDGRDDPWRNLRKDVGEDNLPTIVREEVSGKIARVWIRERNQPAESILKFVREEESWRLDFADDLKAEMQDLPRRMEKANDVLKGLPSDRDNAAEVLRRTEDDLRGSPR